MARGTFVVDISSVQANIRDFPDGVYEAQIKSAKMDVSEKSQQPMLVMDLELYSPTHGTATIKDFLPEAFPAKVKQFWQALNDFTAEEMANEPEVDIDPEALPGAQVLIQLGEQENPRNGKVYKNVTPPWYYATSRAADLLNLEGEPF